MLRLSKLECEFKFKLYNELKFIRNNAHVMAQK